MQMQCSITTVVKPFVNASYICCKKSCYLCASFCKKNYTESMKKHLQQMQSTYYRKKELLVNELLNQCVCYCVCVSVCSCTYESLGDKFFLNL